MGESSLESPIAAADVGARQLRTAGDFGKTPLNSDRRATIHHCRQGFPPDEAGGAHRLQPQARGSADPLRQACPTRSPRTARSPTRTRKRPSNVTRTVHGRRSCVSRAAQGGSASVAQRGQEWMPLLHSHEHRSKPDLPPEVQNHRPAHSHAWATWQTCFRAVSRLVGTVARSLRGRVFNPVYRRGN